MPNPAFIVEGQMEQRFIQNACPGAPVRLLGCNGDSVSINAISTRIHFHLRFLANRYPIIIIFDRERRETTSEEIVAQLEAMLLAGGVSVENIVIGVPDRTIENWILADHACFREELSINIPNACYEGEFGKNSLKQRIGREYHYGETTTGVALLKRMQPWRALGNSPSLAAFLSRLELDCWWLDSTLRQ